MQARRIPPGGRRGGRARGHAEWGGRRRPRPEGLCIIREALAAASPMADAFSLQCLGSSHRPRRQQAAAAAGAARRPRRGDDRLRHDRAGGGQRRRRAGHHRHSWRRRLGAHRAEDADLQRRHRRRLLPLRRHRPRGRQPRPLLLRGPCRRPRPAVRRRQVRGAHPGGGVERCRLPTAPRCSASGGRFKIGSAPSTAAPHGAAPLRLAARALARHSGMPGNGACAAAPLLTDGCREEAVMATDLAAARRHLRADWVSRPRRRGITVEAAMAKAFARSAQRIVDQGSRCGRTGCPRRPPGTVLQGVRAIRISDGHTEVKNC